MSWEKTLATVCIGLLTIFAVVMTGLAIYFSSEAGECHILPSKLRKAGGKCKPTSSSMALPVSSKTPSCSPKSSPKPSPPSSPKSTPHCSPKSTPPSSPKSQKSPRLTPHSSPKLTPHSSPKSQKKTLVYPKTNNVGSTAITDFS